MYTYIGLHLSESRMLQAGGALFFEGANNGSYLMLNESVVSSNSVDSSFTGSTSSGLGGMSLALLHQLVKTAILT